MVNFLPINRTTTPTKTVSSNQTRRVVPSSAADKRETRFQERRLTRDRRTRRGSQQIMDRRSGPERRRSHIDLSI